MADPARYHVELTHGPHGYDILVERGAAGHWVKWLDFVDYKSAQRSNASLDTNTKLGVEIAEMRSTIKDLEAEIHRLRESSFMTAVPSEEYEKLKAENERLTRLLLDLSNAVHIHRANANGSKCDAEINRIVAEVDTIFDIQ